MGARPNTSTTPAFGNRAREQITNTLDPNATGGTPKPYGDYVYEYASKSNRLSRILKDNVQLEAYTYDNAGRLTQRIHATEGTTTYSYDPRGLLTQVTKPGTTISYTYDALGARKSKTVNGTTTKYLTAPIFGMSRVVAELNDNLSLKATYVYGGHQLLKEEPTSGNRSHDVYLLSDGIVGSITHATDSSGQVKDQYAYDAFGIRSTITDTSSSHGHYGYTGQEYDEEAGLLYLRARYYDPKIGRFISADPFWGRLEEPASQNRYAYVHNNPLVYSDPFGFGTLEFTYAYSWGGGGASSIAFDTESKKIFWGQGIGGGIDYGTSLTYSPDSTSAGSKLVGSISVPTRVPALSVTVQAELDETKFHASGDANVDIGLDPAIDIVGGGSRLGASVMHMTYTPITLAPVADAWSYVSNKANEFNNWMNDTLKEAACR